MFARVAVDIVHSDVDRLFTYAIPEGMSLVPGLHVQVPFGKGNRPKEGFVIALDEEADPGFSYKPVLSVIEPYPVLTEEQLELAEWMRRVYHCLYMEALRLMIPAQLRGGRVREKVEQTVSISPSLDPKEALASLTDANGRPKAPKQYEILKLLMEMGTPVALKDLNAFLPGCASSVRALVKKGYLVQTGCITFRRPFEAPQDQSPVPEPTDEQSEVIRAVTESMDKGPGEVFLLHGVTGSGKTEVYLRCIAHALESGKQAIVLVPEIALTPQTVSRFRSRFGDEIAVLHSGLSSGERFDEWRRIRLGMARIAVGARSAVFAPFSSLGLIVIDEEHEAGYQSESSPRYHAAEIAAHRAGTAGCPVLLASATPSVLSYFRTTTGRYRLLSLPHRVQERPLPEVRIADMRSELLAGNTGIFSRLLQETLQHCFDGGHQAMLFINRRGYSTFVSCRACGEAVKCPNCDVSMTYHKQEERLKCHYCGASMPVPRSCPQCGKPFIKYFGVGTEQVEEQLRAAFPGIRSLRMDTDTMQTKDAYARMLSSFSRGEADVLIGTQMIAKGHDFPNVTLVGVIAADATLSIPDYRSAERTFQLLTQVAGRAGRDQYPGSVVIQTYQPEHPAIQFAREHDFDGFFRYELLQRRRGLFPPYTAFIRLLFHGETEEAADRHCAAFAAGLKEALDDLLRPEGAKDLLLFQSGPSPVRKRQGIFRSQILIKLLRTNRTGAVLQLLYRALEEQPGPILEINPQDMF